MHTTKNIQEDIPITTDDGATLAARIYRPKADENCKGGVLISSGTGYPKEFYARFAAFGATRGYACMIYDYRGIGQSAPNDMRTCKADLLDWGTKDAPAALCHLADILAGKPIFTLGHSFGGQMIGLMPNHHLAKAHAFVAVGNGYWFHHNPAGWWQEFLFFFVLGPISLLRYGYLKGVDYWPGSSMPASVFRQWRRWCLSPTYYDKDVKKHLDGANFDMQGAAIHQFAFTDDPVVNKRTAAYTQACYKNARYGTNWITPKEAHTSSIGHSGAFSRKARAFWRRPFDWFDHFLT